MAWNDTFDKIFWVLVAPIFVFLRLNEIRMMTETDWKRKEILILTKLKTFFCSATYGMVFNRWFAKCTLSFCILEKSTRLTGENMLGNHSSPDRLRSVLVRIFNAHLFGMKTFENLPKFFYLFLKFLFCDFW